MTNAAESSTIEHALWHALTAKEALQVVAGNPHGLSAQETESRLKLYGANTVQEVTPVSAAWRFLRQFHNVLIYVLLAAAVVTGATQHWTDMAVIVSVVLINAAIGFIQESKAEKALAAIRGLLSANANVLRDGGQHVIPAERLVPGDIVILAAGDKVPADLRLMETHSLRMQESILTGESLDVEKSVKPVPEDAPLGERRCMAYSGTLVTAGQGKGVVVATGEHTEIGRISAMVGKAEAPQTPLTLKLARFSRWLAGFIVLLSLAVFAFGIMVRGLPLEEMFMVMIGIAVSSIPEGLPAVISITLALGVRAMARENAIVRHLPVIEALGSVTVICTDKTGTLTKNELAVTDIVTAERSFLITGIGYSAEGAIFFDDKEIELAEHPTVYDMGCAALLNNDATLKLRKGIWELNGDPTEGALMAFAHKAGHDLETIRKEWSRTDVIPFSAEARYMATLHHGAEGGVIYVKGAPEEVLAMCDAQQDGGGKEQKLDTDYWKAQVTALAKEGKRVLAVASRRASASHRDLRHEDVREGLTLLGLFGIMDTPREEARDSIAACMNAGIAVKMITGDHVLTASAVGKMLGIPDSDRVMTGADIERLSDEALAKSVEEVNIYARMHPEHKLRLVKAFQANREVVAMTGDGVNDAPALKTADIGIAMGGLGTEVAKEASDLVLTDDNFASIERAIEEGRNITRNIRRTIQFMLVTDGAEGLTLLVAVLAGFTLPITPLQILWVNMVTAVTLSLAFAFAPHDASVMRHPPLPLQAPLFARAAILSFLWHVALIAAGTIGLFLYEARAADNVDAARTMAVNGLVWFEIWYLWGHFPPRKHQKSDWLLHYAPVILASGGVILFQLAFTYLPWMQTLFATHPLNPAEWLRVIAVSAVILLWLWGERRFSFRRQRSATAA
jgi:magnesium-transporting ATPase (P-type)